MNERIKQLYEQSHIERRQEYFSSEVDPTIKSVSVTRHFDPNLFAELIVRECDRYVAKHYDEMEPWMQPGDLLKHFGVDE